MSDDRPLIPTHHPPDVARDDLDALVAGVAVLERTQVDEDVAGFLALFDPAAVWVTGGGRRLIGLDAIADFTRSVLPGAMAGGSVTYEVEHVVMIGADVAVTGVRQTYLSPDGQPTARGLPTYVWVRGADGNWRIAAGQNTAVPDDQGIGGTAR